MGGTIDAYFNGSPLQPAICTAPSGEAGTVDAPLLLFMTQNLTLWVSTGALQTLVIPAGPLGQTETFYTYWQCLSQINNFPATFTNDPLCGNDVYIDLQEPTLSAVLSKLAGPATPGVPSKWQTAFYKILAA
jgi:hypothetical protein